VGSLLARLRRRDERRWPCGPGEWTCMVCGDCRPDARISVYSETRAIRGVEATVNVRYCNDRPACREGAPRHALLGLFDDPVRIGS
jgi:hypothetical protein